MRDLSIPTPAIITAAGILIGTVIAVTVPEQGPLLFVGPLVTSAAMIWAALAARARGMDKALPAGLILAAGLMVATLLVSFTDPANVATLIPLVGGGSVVLQPNQTACRLEG